MTTSPLPITPVSAQVILNIAAEIERADQELKRRTHKLLMSNQQELLRGVLERWLDQPPQQVLDWLNKQAPAGDGST